MLDSSLHRAVLQAFDRGRSDGTVTELRELLARHWDAREVRLLLANYQLTALRTLQDPTDLRRLDNTSAGEAFISQLPVLHGGDQQRREIYLPVSVHGDRLGVLQLDLPGAPTPELQEQLQDLATLVGYALSATGRHTDLLHRAARSQRLTLAAELQWQLLPARGCRSPEYELAGHLEPAYSVYSDSFDWSEDADELFVSIFDAGPHARKKPMLTTLAVTALRNARRAGMQIADQAAMADQAIYAHHQGEEWVSAILMSINIASGQARAVRAGTPRLAMVRAREFRSLGLTDQLPLGMFDSTQYAGQSFELATGDRLLLMSDGVFDALSARGESFSERRLPDVLRETDSFAPYGVVRTLIDDLLAQHENEELDDDAAVVCLDWNGPGRPSTITLSEPVVGLRGTATHLRAVPASSRRGERTGT